MQTDITPNLQPNIRTSLMQQARSNKLPIIPNTRIGTFLFNILKLGGYRTTHGEAFTISKISGKTRAKNYGLHHKGNVQIVY